MKKGFTILELLVASLLLGILTTILTMIFSQSSIAWRTGTAVVADLDDVRDNVAEIREEADNAFVWDNEIYRTTGLWDRNGNFFDRACDASSTVQSENSGRWRANLLRAKAGGIRNSTSIYGSQNLLTVGSARLANQGNTYTVNVMSGGPDGHGAASDVDLWNAIWSNPDVFE
jgi:prepilin-type N-terminal cleavage/methylation domain-containing protein